MIYPPPYENAASLIEDAIRYNEESATSCEKRIAELNMEIEKAKSEKHSFLSASERLRASLGVLNGGSK